MPNLTDEERVERLVQRYFTWTIKHAIQACKKHKIPSKDWNECKQDGLIGCWKAACTYVDIHPTTSFKVFAGCRIKTWVVRYWRYRNRKSIGREREAAERRGHIGHDNVIDLLYQAMAQCPSLTDMQRDYLEMKFGPERMTLTAMGRKYGVSREWARQIIKEALYKLQKVVVRELE